MKLYNKTEFFKLNLPIIFSYYNTDKISGLYECFEFIEDNKGNIIDYSIVDLICTEMIDTNFDNNNNVLEWYDIDYIESGKAFYLNLDSGMRDGLYSKDEKFIVYERSDILTLINKLQDVYIKRYTIE